MTSGSKVMRVTILELELIYFSIIVLRAPNKKISHGGLTGSGAPALTGHGNKKKLYSIICINKTREYIFCLLNSEYQCGL